MFGKKLNQELEELMSQGGMGSGFGDPDALKSYERQIEHLRFKIQRRDKIGIAVLSAFIGATVSIITKILLN